MMKGNYPSDQTLHEAIGWLTYAIGGKTLAVEAHRAKAYPEISALFLQWADYSAEDMRRLEWEDRDRQFKADWPTRFEIIDAEENPDDE